MDFRAYFLLTLTAHVYHKLPLFYRSFGLGFFIYFINEDTWTGCNVWVPSLAYLSQLLFMILGFETSDL